MSSNTTIKDPYSVGKSLSPFHTLILIFTFTFGMELLFMAFYLCAHRQKDPPNAITSDPPGAENYSETEAANNRP